MTGTARATGNYQMKNKTKMTNAKNLAAVAISAMALVACNSNQGTDTAAEASAAAPTAAIDAANGEAGTITYWVYLKPQDMRDPYAHELYDNFDREAFVKSVYTSLYQNHAKVYDYEGNELSLETIRERQVSDPNFSDDKLAGVRFTEEWKFDPATKTMEKKIKEMMLGYEFVEDSTIIAFRENFKFVFDK